MRYLILILIFIVSFTGFGQNLVPNPSFESKSFCPTGLDQLNAVDNWESPSVHPGTPDYFNSCHQGANNVSVPNNIFGSQSAAAGSAYVGIYLYGNGVLFGSGHREYLEVELTDSLKKDIKYKVSFQYTLADKSKYSIDQLGVHFSKNPLVTSTQMKRINVVPQWNINKMISNKGSWDDATFDFVAAGGEKIITVGNFETDANCTLGTSNASLSGSYVYLDDFSIEEHPCNPKLDLGNDTSICFGESIPFDVTDSGASYLWKGGSTSPLFVATSPGTYWVKVSNACGSRVDTIKIVRQFLPNVALPKDTAMCDGKKLVLNAYYPNATYLWQDYTGYPKFTVRNPGKYWVQVTNKCGSVTDTINVGLVELPVIDFGPDTLVCSGFEHTLDASFPSSSYVWQDGSTKSKLEVDTQGVYWVNVTNSCGTYTDSIEFKMIDPPLDIELGDDSTFCLDDVLTINVKQPFCSYFWNDGSSGPLKDIYSSGKYWVEVKNNCGITSDTITVEAYDCSCNMLVPNSFSPNRDGLNDYFQPVVRCELDFYQLRISYKWGGNTNVYETYDLESPWDGTFRNEPVPPGTYIYSIIYRYSGQKTKEKKFGTIQIIP